jgi:transposase-like protein
MNSQTAFCPNPACPATGRTGAGNIQIHDRQKRRYRCTVCHKAFSERKGTPFYRLRKPPELVVTVLTLLAYGCPLVAIVQAFAPGRTDRAKLVGAGRSALRSNPHGAGRAAARVRRASNATKSGSRCATRSWLGWPWPSNRRPACGWAGP